MSTGGDGGDKPSKPDPFAPLPLANVPPTRRREPEPPAPAPVPVESAPPPSVVVDEAWTEAAPAPAPAASEAWSAPPPPAAAAEPILPLTITENDLRDALGVTPAPETKKQKKQREKARAVDDDDDDGTPRKSRKAMFVAALAILLGSGIAALVLVGKVNSARYFITCEAERVVVERGRAFPPWGRTELGGAEWQPLKIPPEAACSEQETEELADLAGWYKKILVDQATKLLEAREVTKVDEAEAMLKQALLVSRSLRTDDDAKNARAEIDRLLGDVVYWRASARLKSAAETLADAAKQFDAAQLQRPAHFNDAGEWAAFARRLADTLKAGPHGTPAVAFPPSPPSERPMAPMGTALPVEPDQGSAAPEPAPAPPDAGLPTGGVLL
ncbi:MAG: hypothetical protein JNL83_32990 [Myxococcales bacterium]|nr:hypothetical protein [Myxococcales bacterium]